MLFHLCPYCEKALDDYPKATFFWRKVCHAYLCFGPMVIEEEENLESEISLLENYRFIVSTEYSHEYIVLWPRSNAWLFEDELYACCACRQGRKNRYGFPWA